MKLTKQDIAHSEQYRKCLPKQFGNLHERMKLAMQMAVKKGPDSLGNDLWQALFDLENEVSYYEPQMPPFGRRTIGVSELPGAVKPPGIAPKTDNGGSAFPCVGAGTWNAGLTMLDWFAGMALQGLLASESADQATHCHRESAGDAYDQAMEMLAVRDRLNSTEPADDSTCLICNKRPAIPGNGACPECVEYANKAVGNPDESPFHWVTQDLVPARLFLDEYRVTGGGPSQLNHWARCIHGSFPITEGCRHGKPINAGNLQLRCRQKDLPPAAQAFGPQTLPVVVPQEPAAEPETEIVPLRPPNRLRVLTDDELARLAEQHPAPKEWYDGTHPDAPVIHDEPLIPASTYTIGSDMGTGKDFTATTEIQLCHCGKPCCTDSGVLQSLCIDCLPF